MDALMVLLTELCNIDQRCQDFGPIGQMNGTGLVRRPHAAPTCPAGVWPCTPYLVWRTTACRDPTDSWGTPWTE